MILFFYGFVPKLYDILVLYFTYLKFSVDPSIFVWRLATQIKSQGPFGHLTPNIGSNTLGNLYRPVFVEWWLVNSVVNGLGCKSGLPVTRQRSKDRPKILWWDDKLKNQIYDYFFVHNMVIDCIILINLIYWKCR